MSNKQYYHSKEFIELQNKWYSKLSEEGFIDLEWLDKKTGLGHSSPFLSDSLSKFKHLQASEVQKTLGYFTLAQAFTLHYRFKTKLHKAVWKHYIEGTSYRKMRPLLKAQGFENPPSIFKISKMLEKLRKSFRRWELKQPNDPQTLAKFMESNDAIS